jgi:hypothetical protein
MPTLRRCRLSVLVGIAVLFGARASGAEGRPLTARDVPNDVGGRIELSWDPAGLVDSVVVARDDGAGFRPVDRADGIAGSFLDGEVSPLANGRAYSYRLEDLAGTVITDTASAVPHASAINTGRLNLLIAIGVFLLLVLHFRGRARRGAALFIRRIAGLDAIEEAVGRATEMGRPILYVPGIDEANNIQTIYSMVILHNVAKMVAKYETPLIVPICRSFVVPLAEETVRAGYMDAGRPDSYRRDNVRYLSDEQFAFTAAVNGIMLRERPAANLFLGSFFAESLMLAETGFSTGAVQIAGTANIHQLPFFVVACDYTLIGEEFFATSAYLSREPDLVGTLKATDWMKVLLIGLLIIGAVLETANITGLTRLMETR